jgi:ABC-2 type transport system ATP-binding protein
MDVLELCRVSKRYGRTTALQDVSLRIPTGTITGLIGSNGAGKTTLLRLCAGLLRASSGTVTGRAVRSSIRYFGGEQTLPPHVPARRWCRSALRRRARRQETKQRFGVLSRGTRQRIGLRATLDALDLRLVLLDEPWEGLDPDASRWLSTELESVRSRGAGVFVSSHRMHDLVAVCDRFEFLIDGRIACPTVELSGALGHERRLAQLFAAYDAARVEGR